MAVENTHAAVAALLGSAGRQVTEKHERGEMVTQVCNSSADAASAGPRGAARLSPVASDDERVQRRPLGRPSPCLPDAGRR